MLHKGASGRGSVLEKSCKLVIGRSVCFGHIVKGAGGFKSRFHNCFGGGLHASLLVNLYFNTNIITCKMKHPPGYVDEKIVQYVGRQSLVFV